MRLKKNKYIIFFIVNVFLLLIIFLLAIPATNFLSKINLSNNEYVKDQVIISPEPKSNKIIDRKLKINFIAKVDNNLKWEFETLQNTTNIKIGENKIIKYKGKNISNRTITSTANFIASPEMILPYLIKTECFCFKEQTLKPGETKIFTMVFFIDSALDNVEDLKELKELVFTYEFSEYKS